MKRLPGGQPLLVLLLVGFTALMLLPIVWAFLTSIKQPVDAFAIPPKLLFTPTFEFHWQVWVDKGFWRYLVHSAIVCACVVAISVSIGTMAAYALSRMHGTLSKGLLFGLLGMRMFPQLLLAIPFFMLARFWHMIDTYPALVLSLVAVNQPFTIWLLHGFFVDVPGDLDEAASIDGCGEWRTFLHIILPMVRPGIAVAAIFSLLLSYNEFLLPLVLSGPHTQTLPVAIAGYGGEDVRYWSLSAAAAIGIMLPIVAIVLLLQRHLVRGLTMGAVK